MAGPGPERRPSSWQPKYDRRRPPADETEYDEYASKSTRFARLADEWDDPPGGQQWETPSNAPPPSGARDGFGANGRWGGGGGSRPEVGLISGFFDGANKYVLMGVFIVGIGAGIALDSVVNIEPLNVASREVIDQRTPNPDICLSNGASAMVLDQRLFISFNPFNVYVSQAEVKPGCVLRQSNWQVLESRGLVSRSQVQDCKRNMNTFGFVGDLRGSPEVSCVYHSERAENQFLEDPSRAVLGDGNQPKRFDD